MTVTRTIKDEVRMLSQRKRPLSYQKMLDIILQRHPDANTSVKTIQWYVSRLRQEGVEVNIVDGRTITTIPMPKPVKRPAEKLPAAEAGEKGSAEEE